MVGPLEEGEDVMSDHDIGDSHPQMKEDKIVWDRNNLSWQGELKGMRWDSFWAGSL